MHCPVSTGRNPEADSRFSGN
ncbi:hypothetical protein CY0110_15597 [Crocosphaera chwakensis CCY0110]|uniref:Uncharacterized protein n=1 Tax=Crocosphaera chwakensis CCY0110 TaxID=391612 RepID=A3IHF1_9CHRO|nr:hypothetical protein CY0110_15597 [Crocosphaera chwakensis CCY0110]